MSEEDRPLTGRARSLANLKPFPKGHCGNRKGRPKDLARFGDILMGEMFKTVPANLAGKVVNKTQGELLAIRMMKNAITGGPPAQKLLLQFIAEHEARQARRAEVQAKKQAEGATELDWDAEREEIYQRLLAATENVQLLAPAQTNEDAK